MQNVFAYPVPLEAILVFDTETTGLSWDDEVLQLAVVDAAGNRLFDGLFRPRRATEWPDAEKVNGISPAKVAGAPLLVERADFLYACFSRARAYATYNGQFDARLLSQSGLDIPARPHIDVMRRYAQVHGTEPAPHGTGYRFSKLGQVAERYGIGDFAAHDAMGDALATAACFREIAEEGLVPARLDDWDDVL